jgi:hypothetical protein
MNNSSMNNKQQIFSFYPKRKGLKDEDYNYNNNNNDNKIIK